MNPTFDLHWHGWGLSKQGQFLGTKANPTCCYSMRMALQPNLNHFFSRLIFLLKSNDITIQNRRSDCGTWGGLLHRSSIMANSRPWRAAFELYNQMADVVS